MGLDYSYTQPSDSEEYGGNTADSGYSETEDLIRQDQAEIDTQRAPVQYPPQPEVEFGFPQTCYCGARPLLATSQSRNDPGRLYYTCANVADGDCHVWKWWDVAVMEEMRARDTHTLQLAEKVDYLAGMSDYRTELNKIKDLQYETEQKMVRVEKLVSELGNKKSTSTNGFGFEYFVGVIVIVFVLIGMWLMV